MEETIRLTEAEWKIMLLLWENGPQTLMQLTHALDAETGWTRHTVIALLKRMADKQTVRVEDDGRTKHFYPNAPKERVTQEQTDMLVRRLFGGKTSLMISNVLERGEMSAKELDELSAMLAQARRNIKE